MITKIEVFYSLLYDSVFVIITDLELESDCKMSEFLEIFLFANLWVYFDNTLVAFAHKNSIVLHVYQEIWNFRNSKVWNF